MGNLSGLLLTPAALPLTGRQIFNFFILETWIVDVQCRCEVGCKRRFPDYVSPLNSKETGEFEGQFDVSSGFFGGGAWAAIFVEQRLDMDP